MLLGEARRGLANFDPSLVPPDEDNLPPPPNASTKIGNPGIGGVGGVGRHRDPQAMASHSGGSDRKTQQSVTGSRAMLTLGGGSNADKPPAPASTQSSAGGHAVNAESVDGNSSIAPASGGKGARTVVSGASYGKTEVRAGLSSFDADMEANRLAYVRHLQVRTKRNGGLTSISR